MLSVPGDFPLFIWARACSTSARRAVVGHFPLCCHVFMMDLGLVQFWSVFNPYLLCHDRVQTPSSLLVASVRGTILFVNSFNIWYIFLDSIKIFNSSHSYVQLNIPLVLFHMSTFGYSSIQLCPFLPVSLLLFLSSAKRAILPERCFMFVFVKTLIVWRKMLTICLRWGTEMAPVPISIFSVR